MSSVRSEPPPAWKLPEGVNAPLWEYTHSERIAGDEEWYFRDHPLLAADVGILDERIRIPGRLVDLGCGTGRLSLHFARRGFPVVAVDLARPMLRVVGERAAAGRLTISRIEANLCRLDCLPDQSFQYAISMFSTLGMIRGVAARRRALSESYRILQPNGLLCLHAHNLWLNLRHGQGRRWILAQAMKALARRPGVGDREMTYRGIPGMEVHLYRWRELASELNGAGFQIEGAAPINAVTARPIAAPWCLPNLRAGGWVVFARRP
jgi:SAM-dependent methyltransferase